ncbi:MAG: hypothetical protein KDH96_01455 [Candidatus Riesia sp.]|nr:hypothetical protein [Candidatus Riesia sp.]
MSYFIVDVESDGAILGRNSMVCFGAVLLDKEGNLDKTFYGQTAPISKEFDPEALAVSGFSREEHELFEDPKLVMTGFADWIELNTKGRAVLVSDNNGYDASWINWYFHTYYGDNPFGWSSRRIGDMFAGFMNDPFYKWKKHRGTVHDHNPVNDAKGNAEALLWLVDQGFKLNLK